ncbi:gamma-glutamyltransferase [Pandoraea terrae]|uniref:Glutathione hydrolase proenzyme n=1 Tax=Pandoraea terrae TaxID=1537710 RepID=A0A5E4VUY6_9BURK|nr:gamma-glutamyltransferase [Pandoraea terrae]VVE14860.1 gamma-glutamyltransferase [Pandoraea terrae]
MRNTRPVCMAERGMVASAHYLASSAALDILKAGGHAVDAAICAASTLGVVAPQMVGIGGDAFWLIYDARSKTLSALNGSGQCGREITRECFADEGVIPQRGPRSAITVPGAVDSWRLAHARFGRLPMAQLLEPSIHYARAGVPVSGDLAQWIQDDIAHLAADPGAASVFLDGGRAWQTGDRLLQPALAQTLENIAQRGPRHFYDDAARSIVHYLRDRAGLLSHADFQQYQACWVDPISTRYRGYDVFQLPPPSQGMAGLMILNFLSGVRLSRDDADGAKYYHSFIQAVKWAFGYRDRYLTDPAFASIPLSRLLDRALAAQERDRWLGDARLTHQSRPSGSDTTFISVADAEGNAVGLVQSLYYDFGACVVDPGTGVLLQNRGSFFSLDPAHPNVIAPGKQSASTLMSGMVFKDGAPYMVYGTQGGEVQPQTQTSLITRVLDFGMDVQTAIEAPRLLYGRSWGDSASKLLVESTAPGEAVTALRAMGHPVETVGWPHMRMGTAQAVRLRGAWSPFFEGGADPRGEGVALGY